MTYHKHLKRLDDIWENEPIFFITTCTNQRYPLLANERTAPILIDGWRLALERHGWAVGRYVIMPDHVHFFCALDTGCITGKPLSSFLQYWKQWTSKRIIHECNNIDMPGNQITPALRPPIWQSRFFDHLIRSWESYAEKWEYVQENPVRAGLVNNSKEWVWQGEIYEL